MNMKTSQIFKLAKNHIDKHKFLCVTIRFLPIPKHELSIERRNEVVNVVQGRITKDIGDKGTTLESWLLFKHGIHADFSDLHTKKMQVTRLAWLDSLIAEFEAIGD
jgi:hypothetical protein